MKVYVLLKRHEEWSDYALAGVFSSKEGATEAKNKASALDLRFQWYFDIEALALDEFDLSPWED